MSTAGLDPGQVAVVEYLRRYASDPARTSIAELRPTGRRHGAPHGLFCPTERAVFGVIRAPNPFGAMTVQNTIFFLDNGNRVQKIENDHGDLAGPWFAGALRHYYPGEPESEAERNERGLREWIINVGRQGPTRVPRAVP